jgi:hypothetical protein
VAEQNPVAGARSGPKRTDPTSQLARGELKHAEVEPLDVSGIPSVLVGIAAWVVALVVLLVFRDDLERDGNEWWLWVAVTGLALGVIGLAYCRHRWAAIQVGHRTDRED